MTQVYQPRRMALPHTLFRRYAKALARRHRAVTRTMAKLRWLESVSTWMERFTSDCATLSSVPLWGTRLPRLVNLLDAANDDLEEHPGPRRRRQTGTYGLQRPARANGVTRPNRQRRADSNVLSRTAPEATKHWPADVSTVRAAPVILDEHRKTIDRVLLGRLAGVINANNHRASKQRSQPLNVVRTQRRYPPPPLNEQQLHAWRRTVVARAEHTLRTDSFSSLRPTGAGATLHKEDGKHDEPALLHQLQPSSAAYVGREAMPTLEDAWTSQVAGESVSTDFLLAVRGAGAVSHNGGERTVQPPANHLRQDGYRDANLRLSPTRDRVAAMAEASRFEPGVAQRPIQHSTAEGGNRASVSNAMRHRPEAPASSTNMAPLPQRGTTEQAATTNNGAGGTNGSASFAHSLAPELTLPGLAAPPQRAGAELLPPFAQTTARGEESRHPDPIDEGDLSQLAVQMKRILDEEARRHGIDV